MPNSIISEGKTTNEAIENGLKILHTTKNNVGKDRCNGMFLYEIDRIYLIIMWIVSHPVFLQSAPDHQVHRSGSLIYSEAGAAMLEVVSDVLRDA